MNTSLECLWKLQDDYPAMIDQVYLTEGRTNKGAQPTRREFVVELKPGWICQGNGKRIIRETTITRTLQLFQTVERVYKR